MIKKKTGYLRPNYKSNRQNKRIAAICIISLVGLTLIHAFLFSDAFSGGSLNSTNASEFGSFIGGYLGTIFAVISVLFLYLTFQDQRRTSELEKFETRFFELIRIHRDNVEEIALKDEPGKKVFVLLIREFRELFKIVKKIFLNQLTTQQIIEISYIAFFYGVGPNSSRLLRSSLSEYPSENIDRLIKIMAETKDDVKKERNFKYTPFEGHQSRLGHYYRHLYQSIKYCHTRSIDIDKYEYIKLIRAQLSNHEQALLFLNAQSRLGRPWMTPSKGEDRGMLEEYRMIKNLPEQFFCSQNEFPIKKLLPNFIFDYEEQTIKTNK